MNNWETVRYEDVCRDITVGFVGSMADEYIDEGILFLRSQNIEPFKLNLSPSQVRYISKEFHKKLKKSALFLGDIAIVRTGYPGTSCVIPENIGELNCSDLVIMRPNHNLSDSHFLCYYLNSPYGMGEIEGNLVGAAQQHFNVGVAKRIKIKLPPLPIQKKIASILSAYDELIENNNQRIKLLEEMAEEIYKEWFVRLRFPGYEHTPIKDGVPEGWNIKRLSEITVLIKRGVSPSYDDEGETLAINQRCIRDHKIDISIARRQNKKIAKEKILKNGDILINSTGEGTLGRIAQYFDDENNITVDSHVTIVRAGSVDEIFLGDTLIGLEKLFEYLAVGSTGQTELNREVISSTKITVPTKLLQQKYSGIARPMKSQIKVLIEKNQILKETRDLLLPRLISGKLSVEHLLEESEPAAMAAETSEDYR